MIKHAVLTKGFDQSGGHHELQLENMMQFYPGYVDFLATATHFPHFISFLFSQKDLYQKLPREAMGIHGRPWEYRGYYSLNEDFSGAQ